MERLQGGTGMKKKLVGVLLTAAMAVSALAGCGSKQAAAPAESKAAEEKTETVQEATEEAEAAEGEEVLTVWCWDPNFNVYAMKQAEALYQKEHPNFKLDIQEKVYTDIEQSLILSLIHILYPGKRLCTEAS